MECGGLGWGWVRVHWVHHYQPPTTDHQPPTTNPLTTTHQPRTNHQPPTTNHQPPTTNHQRAIYRETEAKGEGASAPNPADPSTLGDYLEVAEVVVEWWMPTEDSEFKDATGAQVSLVAGSCFRSYSRPGIAVVRPISKSTSCPG